MSVHQGKGQTYEGAQVRYLSRIVTFADGTVSLGWLPGNSFVIDAGVNVRTAFNAGTNNHLNIGQRNSVEGRTAAANTYTGTPLAGQTLGTQKAGSITGTGAFHYAAPVEITATYAPTGTAATAGVAQVFVAYVDNGPFEG